MILLDTSVWIDHYRHANETVVTLLNDTAILTHPFVVGELACGNLRDRKKTLLLHQLLPAAVPTRDDEVLAFIEANDLPGKGIGYVDAHLLASTVLTSGALIWTHDKRLADVARELGIAFIPPLSFRMDDEGGPVYERTPGDTTVETNGIIKVTRNERGTAYARRDSISSSEA